MGRHGENIHKRKDGRWEARVVCGSPVDGKTRYKSLYSYTYLGVKDLKKEYLLQLRIQSEPLPSAVPISADSAVSTSAASTVPASAFSAAPLSVDLPAPALTVSVASASTAPAVKKSERSTVNFRTVAAEWLTSKKLSVKESTYTAYSFMVEKHLLPVFGDLVIKEISSEQIAAFLMDKKEHGGIRNRNSLSEKTISEIKGTLNRVLRYAKSRNLIDAVPDSMPVSVKRPPIAVLTKQEQASLETEALNEDSPFSLGVLLCMNTGMREGELCGLKWEDFDWENETVSIRRTVYRIPNLDAPSDAKTRVVIEKPKTVCSIRTIPLPSDIVPYIKERAGEGAAYVVTGSEKCMEPRVCRDRYARFEARAGVNHHNFHILRHTYATNCVEDGVNTKVLSENLGHSNVNITLQLYVHPSMKSKKTEVNKLTNFMNRGQIRGQNESSGR